MKCLLPLALLLCGLFSGAAFGQSYTYNGNGNASGTTDLWSTGANWNTGSAPVGGAGTALTFAITSADTNLVIATSNNLGTFQLSSLTFAGDSTHTGPSTAATYALSGGALDFVDSSPGSGATITDFGAKFSSGVNLAYNISNALILDTDLTIVTSTSATQGSASFNFTGAISGTGNIIRNSGGGTTTIASGTNNANYNWSGDMDLLGNGGRLNLGGSLFTQGSLTMGSGTSLFNGTLAVSSIASSVSNDTLATTLILNDAGVSQSFAGNLGSGGTVGVIVLNGAGNLALSVNFAGDNAGSSSTVKDNGTGTITLAGVTIGALPTISNSLGTISFTGGSSTSSVTLGNVGGTALGGTYLIDPTAQSAAIVETGLTTAAATMAYYGGVTIDLEKGANTSLLLELGNAANTVDALARKNAGTLILTTSDGLAALGGTERLVVLGNNGTASAVPVVNGIVSPYIFGANNDAAKSGDFLTYVGTGAAGDSGFEEVTAANDPSNYLTGFAGSGSTSVVELTTSQSALAANAGAYALRDDIALDLGGFTLALGNPGAGANQSNVTGLILNGGTIGDGVLNFGASELSAYVSGANGTIGAKVSGSGYGGGGFLAGLTKSGPGTLFLTATNNNYSGVTVISQGALDVGTNGAGLSSANGAIELNGGVLEGNGTLTKNLGNSTGGIFFSTGNNTNIGPGGGFAAYGGSFDVTLVNGGAPLSWGALASGATDYFLPDAANGQSMMLMFGAATANNQIILENAIDLGQHATTGGSDSPNYYRDIYVTAGTGGDSALIKGAISSTDPHGLLKDGNGTLILAGANTYAGLTSVAEGKLMITGTTSGQGAYTVNTGATLGGAGGTIGTANNAGVTLQSGSFLSVSDGGIAVAGAAAMTPGRLTLALGTGALDLSAAVTGSSQALIFVLGSTGASDSVFLSGGSLLNIGSGLLGFNDFNFIASSGFGGGTYVLFDTGAANDLVGSLGTGLTGTVDGLDGTISLSTDTNGFQDIVLTIAAVPEPGTWALLASAGAAVPLLRRRARLSRGILQ